MIKNHRRQALSKSIWQPRLLIKTIVMCKIKIRLATGENL
jgi:hypothetical protein